MIKGALTDLPSGFVIGIARSEEIRYTLTPGLGMSLQLITVHNYRGVFNTMKTATYRCVKLDHDSDPPILGVFDHLSNIVLTVNVVLVIGTLYEKKGVTQL